MKDLPHLDRYFQVSRAFVNKGQQSETESSVPHELTVILNSTGLITTICPRWIYCTKQNQGTGVFYPNAH